jgi:hypothetical protein
MRFIASAGRERPMRKRQFHPELTRRNYYLVQLATNLMIWIVVALILQVLMPIIGNYTLMVALPAALPMAIWGSGLQCPNCGASFMWQDKTWRPRRKCRQCKWPAETV